jgi:adenine-specific DNA-methyltransferase
MVKYGFNTSEKCVEQVKTHHFLLEEDNCSFQRFDGRHSNILIQGENYQALKVLVYTHAGKIDCIYIDPPYNTGNKDLVYDDRFVDAEDTYRHSKWRSFMERRLKLAKELLSDRGVILISIDDNEQAHLKVLCDEVFGEQNFIANLIWKKKATNGGISNGGFGVNIQHEYVLMYAKNKSEVIINGIPGGEELDAKYKSEDDKGKYRLVDFAGYGLSYQESMDYEIEGPDGKLVRANDVMGVAYKARWRWGKKTYEENKDQIVWVKGKPKTKTYMNGDCQLVHPSSLLDDKELLANTDDTHSVVSELNDFPYRKPANLIKHLLSIATQKDSIILDFFAGSGTTGQAVAELNAEDGGTRQFILVTNNDKSEKLPEGICRQVTFPRLEKTIGNENLQVFRVKPVKKEGKYPTNHIDQLVDGNKLLPIIKLKFNTFVNVERSPENAKFPNRILTNHDASFFLGVWDNGSYGGGKAFKQKLDAFCKNNEILVCRESTYPRDFYQMINESK